MQQYGDNLLQALQALLAPCQTSPTPVTFEQLGQAYGYVLYETTLNSGGTNLTATNLKDFGYVYVNEVYQVWAGIRHEGDFLPFS